MRACCLDCGTLFLTTNLFDGEPARCPACSLKYPKKPKPKPAKKSAAAKRKKAR